MRRKAVSPDADHARHALAAPEYEWFFHLSLELLCLAGFDGYFKVLNPAWEQVLGFRRAELMSKPFIDFVHPDDRQATIDETAKLATGVETIHFENRYLCKDGSYKWLAWSCAPAAETQLLYAAARDVTDQKAAAEALASMNSELVRVSQHKTQFLANMSHELRTPLNAILGFSQIMQDRADSLDQDKRLTFLKYIHDSGEHLLALINDVLDLSKVEAGQMDLKQTYFDLGETVQTVLETLRPLADEKGIRLVHESASVGLVFADQGKVKQILYNLVANAIKFTPEEGRVVIVANRLSAGIGIAVIDNGVGIQAADQERVFEEFQQVDSGPGSSQKGTGLGLALTRRFVELHGGRIWVDSEPGIGSAFRILLPAGEAQEKEGASIPEQEPGSQVLIVEDSQAASNFLTMLLSRAGFGTVTVAYGREVLERARRLQPAVIILDILLPDTDGWEVLKQLKSDPVTREVPVVIVSVAEDHGLGEALGAADHLVKPVDSVLLIRRLRQLTNRRTVPAAPASSSTMSRR